MLRRTGVKSTVFAAIGAVMLAALGVAPAAAQTSPIPDALITKTTALSPDERGQVEAYVSAALADFLSGDSTRQNRGRERLVNPISADRANVSVAFRQAYSESVVPGLRSALEADDEKLAGAALFVAGQTATQAAWDLLDQHLNDESVTKRMSAAGGAQALLRAVQTNAPAVQPAAISRIVARLDAAYGAEQNAWVADSLSRGLAAAGGISRDGFGAAASDAWARLAITTGNRHKAYRGNGELAAARARMTTLRVLERLNREVLPPVTVEPRIARESAVLGGIALGTIAADALANNIDESTRSELVLTARVAGLVIDLACIRLNREALGASKLADMLENGDDVQFGDAAKRIVLRIPQLDPQIDARRFEEIFK